MKTKALVMDIDGTLTNSRKEITPATGRAIRTILERGHKVVLASGRSTFGMRQNWNWIGLAGICCPTMAQERWIIRQGR